MAVKNQLATRNKVSISAYLTNDAVKNQINKVLGNDGSRFMSSLLSAVQTTPALQECTNQSLVNAALLGEALKLSPSPQLGHFYMVPFKNTKKGVTEAQFQLGYKGYIQLAIRSGYYKKLNVLPIKAGELIHYDPLNEEINVNIIQDELARESADTIGYYAMFEYENGFRKSLYWSKEKMENHAITYSKGYQAKKGYTFWERDFDGMACKTMLRQLISKWGIMSIDMQSALEKDMAVIHDDNTVDYVDSDPMDDDVINVNGKDVATDQEADKESEPSNDDATVAQAESNAGMSDAAKAFFEK